MPSTALLGSIWDIGRMADLYLKTNVIGNLSFKAIKEIRELISCLLIFRTIVRWFHSLGQEQDHGFQDYGQCQFNERGGFRRPSPDLA